MKKLKNKKFIVPTIITLILIVLGSVAYAYFQGQIGPGATASISVDPKTVDEMKFSDCGAIDIHLTQANLAEGGNNVSDSTCAKVTLRANNDTNSATGKYSLGVSINSNNFVYSTAPTNTPEIIMSVTNPSGNPVTTISGLTYTTVKGVSGFDITTKTGTIQIADEYTISANATPTTQQWTITFTVINLDTNQAANAGKEMHAEIVMGRLCNDPVITETYHTTCDTDLLACKVAKNFDSTNIETSKVVLHDSLIMDDNCSFIDAQDQSYRYTGGDYDVTQTAISAGYSYVNTYNGNLTGGVIGVKCSGTTQYVGYSDSSCSTKYYYLLYDSNVTQYSTYDAALSKAITDGYLIARNLNNYVCYGYNRTVASNYTSCPASNLYRIIGAFDDDNDGNYNIKLIKADYASTTEFGTNAQNGTSSYNSYFTSNQYTGYHGTISSVNGFRWYGTNTNYTNRWDNSTFRTGVLNDYYLNTYLGNTWKNMLVESTYYLGGPGKTGYTTYTPKALYNTERTAEAVYDTTTYPASIDNYVGLMYSSDYGYASETSTWSTGTNTYVRANGNDWIYNGIDEWTITPNSASTNNAICVFIYGYTDYYNSVSNGYAARPVMYLDSGTEVFSGTGSKSDPYYIDEQDYTYENTFNYSANVQTVQIVKGGYYKLEVWGAAGGSRGANYGTAGKGGYSVGTVHLNANDNLYIHTGGQGSTAGTTATVSGGGVNGGGGSKYSGSGGGGGTDIRINNDSLYARVIVAGGGGGAQGRSGTNYRGNGGAGGGTSGTNGTYQNGTNTDYYGHGGTATTGGTTYTGGTAGYRGTAGSFGTGGSGGGRSTQYGGAGGGGGGWYGGGGGYYRYAGGGGGSGYVFTSATKSNYPSGLLLADEYLMVDATTSDGTTTYGNASNGYAKVTYCGQSASDCN